MPLYLVWHEAEREIDLETRASLDGIELRPGLLLVDSGETRSRLYHRVKWALPRGTSLLVAPLADSPKFKGMEAGALNWLRARR